MRQRTVESGDGTQLAYFTLGDGPALLVVGGALATAADYFPLAQCLASEYAVHVLERRGRGASGPQGPGYGIATEIVDLQSVHDQTGAQRVFGHSYGGLIALETAKVDPRLTRIAVFEPGVAAHVSFSAAWLEPYRQSLAAGDSRGAFARFVQHAGHGSSVLARMPLAYVKLVLRLAIKGERWRRMEPLLEANLREHEQVAKLADTLASYSA